mmetsp:Transcript_84194/g.219934  ORF Transcript_84194/g.219934 Transcript_84194/m.219934 type:complete len:219 (-) Transcript_84194:842-1498(-)
MSRLPPRLPLPYWPRSRLSEPAAALLARTARQKSSGGMQTWHARHAAVFSWQQGSAGVLQHSSSYLARATGSAVVSGLGHDASGHSPHAAAQQVPRQEKASLQVDFGAMLASSSGHANSWQARGPQQTVRHSPPAQVRPGSSFMNGPQANSSQLTGSAGTVALPTVTSSPGAAAMSSRWGIPLMRFSSVVVRLTSSESRRRATGPGDVAGAGVAASRF